MAEQLADEIGSRLRYRKSLGRSHAEFEVMSAGSECWSPPVLPLQYSSPPSRHLTSTQDGSLPDQGNCAMCHNLVSEIVDDTIERKHHKFVVYFFDDAFLAPTCCHSSYSAVTGFWVRWPSPGAVKTSTAQAAFGAVMIVCDGLDISATVLCTLSDSFERAKSAWARMPMHRAS